MNFLFVIPARGGSKGIPGKNIKPLAGKPLIYYSLEFARQFTTDENICISTDAESIAEAVNEVGYKTPFVRPAHLATDSAGTFEVLQHALSFYEEQGRNYDAVILLQPTSPFRESKHFEESAQLFNKNIDMVVSVTEAASNPYFNLFEEGADGYLKISKGNGSYLRRQDAPKVYEYNGSIYIINTASVQLNKSVSELDKVVKYVMGSEYAIDLDTQADWKYAEFMHAKMNSA
jgi:N-acylneuraminate cytidylyltransferase